LAATAPNRFGTETGTPQDFLQTNCVLVSRPRFPSVPVSRLQILSAHKKGEPAAKAAERAVVLKIKTRGEAHHDTADSLDAIALDLLTSGEAAEAEKPARKGLAIREKALPANHPDLAESNERLAAIVRKLGKGSDA
jgi:hypothetical protein